MGSEPAHFVAFMEGLYLLSVAQVVLNLIICNEAFSQPLSKNMCNYGV